MLHLARHDPTLALWERKVRKRNEAGKENYPKNGSRGGANLKQHPQSLHWSVNEGIIVMLDRVKIHRSPFESLRTNGFKSMK
jgi:hypothetical protein